MAVSSTKTDEKSSEKKNTVLTRDRGEKALSD